MSEHSTQHEGHGPGYGLFIAIWAALLVLTATTVWVAGINLGFLNVVAALAVATTKASLVIFFFMHLKYEELTLKLMVLTAFVILSIFIGMTFFDTAYR
ncbi:MAG: cytochrome C oxidase subunit IV family protein [Proteobacteria bacterium]|nr:cytochrome C oxidase subunit IV family protein [Pseudomonadota bacterium]MBU1611078.1 cytochrome C oxidase subunit IV family protein [Pseudomonadota bacterium]